MNGLETRPILFPNKEKVTTLNRLLCKMFGHHRSGFSIEVKEGLVSCITWYCDRCNNSEKAPVHGSDRMDIAVGLALAGLDKQKGCD